MSEIFLDESGDQYFEWDQPEAIGWFEPDEDYGAYEDEAWPDQPVVYPDDVYHERRGPTGFQIIGVALFWMVIVLAGLTSVLTGGERVNVAAAEAERPAQPVRPTPAPAAVATAVSLPASDAIIVPYDEYTVTQGLHGFSYGHMAIDIAAGKGAEIKAPIEGVVSELSIDEWGNTVLVLENERYQVLLLHGNYTVALHEEVKLGEVIGTEGNNGYTKDMYGNLCYGRECGYHTHLNIFDKRLQANVDPFEVLNIRR